MLSMNRIIIQYFQFTALNNLCPAFAAAKKSQIFDFYSLRKHHHFIALFNVNEINKCFILRTDSTKILFNPFRKAQNTRKVIETSNKPVFKDKILIVWRGRIISKRTSDIKFISAQT